MDLKQGIISIIILTSLSISGCASTGSSVPSTEQPTQAASGTLSQQMKIIGASYKAFNTTEDKAEALQALDKLQQATVNSKQMIPVKIANNASEIAAYQADLDRMLAIIEQSKTLVNNNQLTAAKTLAQQLNTIKDIAHPRYR